MVNSEFDPSSFVDGIAHSRTLYLKVTTSKETGQNVVTLRPPVEIENCSVFLIHYMIPGRQNQRWWVSISDECVMVFFL